tara:strand:- start:757 stop:1338 length:582 start_codon:yes stop_codon:yes gene_type:complete
MIKQNIVIINFNPLYEILDEIKENLSFQIKQYDNEENFFKDNNSDAKNSLIILKHNQKLLLNKENNNFLILKDPPFLIVKLVELINIHLIKLRFNLKSKININGYELNLNSKFFSKKNTTLKLTEKEIEIILYLSENKKKHDVLSLQNNIWGYSSDMETHTVETHIYRLRKKIIDKFNDDKFILSNKKGYYID